MDWIHSTAERLREILAQQHWLEAWRPTIAATPDWALLAAGPATLVLLWQVLRLVLPKRAKPSKAQKQSDSHTPPPAAPARLLATHDAPPSKSTSPMPVAATEITAAVASNLAQPDQSTDRAKQADAHSETRMAEPPPRSFVLGDILEGTQSALLEFHRGSNERGRALAAAAWASETGRSDEIARSLIDEAKQAIPTLAEGDSPQRRLAAQTLRNAGSAIAERDLGAACMALAEAREIEPLNPINANRLGELLLVARVLDSAQTSFAGAYLASAAGPSEDKMQQGIALTGLGSVAAERSDWNQAEESFQKALSLFESLNLRKGQIRPLAGLADCAGGRSDWKQAKILTERALTLARELDIKNAQAMLLDNLGNVQQKLGDLSGAEVSYLSALTLDSELGREDGRAATLGNLGLVYEMRGDLEAAEKLIEEAREIDHRLGLKRQEATDLHNLAKIAQTRNELTKAEALYRQSLTINEDLGLKERQASQLVGLGAIARDQGKLDEAQELFRKAQTLSKELGDAEGEVIALHNLADITAKTDPAIAAVMFRRALEINRKLGRREGEARNLGKLGQLNRELGLLDEAEQHHAEALAIHDELGSKLGRAAELFNLGLVSLLREDRSDCYRRWMLSRTLYEEMGIADEVADIDARIAHFHLGPDNEPQPAPVAGLMARERAAISILTAMTFADGEMQDQEAEWLINTCSRHPWFSQISSAEFSRMLKEALDQLGGQPWPRLVSQWAQSIPAVDHDEMYGLALHLGLADDEPLGLELPLLRHLQQCFGISEARAQEIFKEKVDPSRVGP